MAALNRVLIPTTSSATAPLLVATGGLNSYTVTNLSGGGWVTARIQGTATWISIGPNQEALLERNTPITGIELFGHGELRNISMREEAVHYIPTQVSIGTAGA